MRQPTYIKFFDTYRKAKRHLIMKKDCNRQKHFAWAIVDGPENNYAVVDLNTAINDFGSYEF